MRVLSLDGGGYLGLATVAFLEATERHFNSRAAERFDMFAGTSTGAIIACALAIGKTAGDITQLYQDLGTEVFPPRLLASLPGGWVTDLFVSRFDNEALKASLQRVFGDATVGDVQRRGKFLLIPAYCLTSGRPRLFKTDHSGRLSRDSGRLLRDIALASAAAPTYLPIVPLRDPQSGCNELYCDGGVAANNPSLLAYTEALCELNVPPGDLAILSISTPRPDMTLPATLVGEPEDIATRWGGARWVNKGKLTDIFINAPAMIADTTLRRLIGCHAGAHYERIDLRRPPRVEMDVATTTATAALRHVGEDHAAQNHVRAQVQRFFRD